MCDLDRPVYRFGRIVRGSSALELQEDEAMAVAEALVVSSEDISNRILTALSGIDLTSIDLIDVPTNAIDISAVFFDERRTTADLQDLPVILVNFPKMRLIVGDAIIEFRFCITVCVKHKKSKCWLRFNLLPGDGVVRNRFFRLVSALSEQIIDTVVSEYQAVIRTTVQRHNEVDLQEHYTLEIKSASSDVEALEDAYNVRFGDFSDHAPVEFDSKLVLEKFQELDGSIEKIPSQDWEYSGAFKERLVGYSATREFPHKYGPAIREKLHALMILRFGEKRAHFLTVGYDPLPETINHEQYFPSMGHIVSLNVSSEYARKF